ncbi:MAG: hypothetical protein JXR83_22105 [Deltaproteobacteria bacterium]|nr:hypothetical protein [Deltaproteobacteria bacterium]
MADCPIATRERMLALLARKLPAAEQKQLRAHLRTPCERCLELLEQLGEDELATALAGDKARLSRRERKFLFRSTLSDELQPTTFWDGLRGLAQVPTLLPAYTAVLALVVGFGIYHLAAPPDARQRYTGIKAAGEQSPALQVSLIAVVGKVTDGQPDVIRRAANDEQLASDELLLFRYRLNEPAYVYLLAEGSDGLEILYRGDAELATAGEHELGSEEQALALDVRLLGADAHIALVASAERLPLLSQIESLDTLIDPERRVDACLSCAVDALRVRAPAQP